jgi:hypothetical protein
MSIARFIRRAAQPGNYTTQYGLPQSSVDYLNQPLPDISGIFSLPQATEVMEENVTDTESPVGLTEEQLRLLYPQVGGGDGPRGGGDFGNLDLSDTKDFFINGEVVTGFRNLNTGFYQDFQGKNIQNLGIRNLPGITGILDSMRTTAPKYPGYFDYYNASDLITNPRSFFNFFKSQTPTGADIARYRGEQKKLWKKLELYHKLKPKLQFLQEIELEVIVEEIEDREKHHQVHLEVLEMMQASVIIHNG